MERILMGDTLPVEQMKSDLSSHLNDIEITFEDLGKYFQTMFDSMNSTVEELRNDHNELIDLFRAAIKYIDQGGEVINHAADVIVYVENLIKNLEYKAMPSEWFINHIKDLQETYTKSSVKYTKKPALAHCPAQFCLNGWDTNDINRKTCITCKGFGRVVRIDNE